MKILGLEVLDYLANSYGQSIGLTKGDLIVSFNMQPIYSVDELKEKIAASAGNDVTYKVIRASEEVLINGKSAPLGLLLQPRADSSQQEVSSNSLKYDSDYGAARGVAKFISFLGWLVFIGGVLMSLIGLIAGMEAQSRFGGGGVSIISMLPGFGISIAGLFLVAGGQVTRATVDSADHTREILRVLSKNA